MTVPDYLARTAAALGVGFAEIRFDDPAAARGPAVLVAGTAAGGGVPVLSGRAAGETVEATLEARSPTADGAARLAQDLVARFRADGRLADVIEESDRPDSATGQRQRVYIRELTVRLT